MSNSNLVSNSDEFTTITYKKRTRRERYNDSDNYNDKDKLIGILRKELTISQNAIVKHKQENAKCNENIDNFKTQLYKLLELNIKLEKENCDLKTENTDLKKQEQSEEIKIDYSKLKEENTKLKEKIDLLKKEIHYLKKKQITLNYNNNILVKDNIDLIDIKKYLTEENLFLTDENSILIEELEYEKKVNYDLNIAITKLNEKKYTEDRYVHTNYKSSDGSTITKNFYVIDICKIKEPNIDVETLFNNEYNNLFTFGYFHWALPTGKKIGDIIIIKHSIRKINFMLRVFNTFPMETYYSDYNYLGNICMACIPAN